MLRPAEERISWKEKRQILSNLYGRGGLVVVCETGVVVHEAPPDAHRWNIEDYGIPTIISNLDELIISIADIDTAEPHREYSITLDADYKVQESYFHTFICEDDDSKDLLVGLSFANADVARRIAEAVDQLTPGKLFKLTDEQRKSLRKTDISQPAEFKHLSHIGGDLPTNADPISGLSALERQADNGAADMEVNEQKVISPPQAVRPSPPQGSEVRPSPLQSRKATFSQSLKNAQRKKNGQSKKPGKGGRRVLEISSPMEFQHVAHMGENCFAPKNEDGNEDPFQMSGDFNTGTAARKRSKTPSTSSERLLSSGSGEEPEVKKSRVPMDISSPHDFQHVTHISKDTAISAFMLTGKKDPFSIITAIANSPPTSSPPKPANVPPAPPPPAPPPPPEPPKLPSDQPTHRSESPNIKSPKIKYPPAPPQLDSSEFLKEISSFNPALLRHVSVGGKKPPADPSSLQEILKNSFENMRGRLQSMWRDSIITTFGDQLDGDDEFDYPGVFLPEDVLAELEQ